MATPANYGPVYEYWASVSRFHRGPVYALSAHKADVYVAGGADPYASLADQARTFYTIQTGETDMATAVEEYYDSLDLPDWVQELIEYDELQVFAYPGLDYNVSQFIDYVIANQAGPWVKQGTNQAINPNMVSTTGLSWAGTSVAKTQEVSTEQSHNGTTSIKQTINATGQTGLMVMAATTVPGTVRWSGWVYTTRAGTTVNIYAEGNRNGSYFGATSSNSPITIPANQWVKFEGVAELTPATYDSVRFGIYNLQVQTGDVVYYDEWLIEQEPAPIAWFDGNNASSDTELYGWVGTPDASASTYSTREVTTGHTVYVQPDQPPLGPPWVWVDTDNNNLLYISDGA